MSDDMSIIITHSACDPEKVQPARCHLSYLLAHSSNLPYPFHVTSPTQVPFFPAKTPFLMINVELCKTPTPDENELLQGELRSNRGFIRDIIFKCFAPANLSCSSTLYFPGYFFNVFYLVVGLSQLFPQFVIGPLFTYLAPLVFVVTMSVLKEALDDYKRYCRDRELNSQLYELLVYPQDRQDRRRSQLRPDDLEEEVPEVAQFRASDIRVGDVLRLHTGQRVPADCILIKTFNPEGTCFIRTDQLDGETDWKLKRALGVTQSRSIKEMVNTRGTIDIEAPRKDIYNFLGTCSIVPATGEAPTDNMTNNLSGAVSSNALSGAVSTVREGEQIREPLSTDNTLWTNAIMTSGPVLALVIFTGENTRAAKHRGVAEPKISAFDLDINRMSKLLCAILCLAAFILTLGKPLNPLSPVYLVRFILLLSSIIPISLRVNFDIAKLVYSYFVHNDGEIPGTIVRNSTLPEELGRIGIIVSDKTGTLTQNKMSLQSIVCANKVYNVCANSVAIAVNYGKTPYRNRDRSEYSNDRSLETGGGRGLGAGGRGLGAGGRGLGAGGRGLGAGVIPISQLPYNGPVLKLNPMTDADYFMNSVMAISLCHSVLPAYDYDTKAVVYEASSPDEMAMVQWCDRNGIKLAHRDLATITIELPPLAHSGGLTAGGSASVPLGGPATGSQGYADSSLGQGRQLERLTCDILETFAFSSSRKRMGIILRDRTTGQILYLLKGGEVALLKSLVQRPQWLLEELESLSSSGLRTLVYSWKALSEEEYSLFRRHYDEARNSLVGRNQKCHDVIDRYLEYEMQLVGLTGVEDELQVGVADTVESLLQAGIKIWMLTGDKVDTALCIATSAGLRGRMDVFVKITGENCVSSADVAHRLRRVDHGHESEHVVVCIDNFVVSLLLDDRELAALFMLVTAQAKSVLCCRCSPSQKAQVVALIKKTSPGLRIAAVGDGGNDVPMIQAAHCGIGILGKEGRQASLAADFSINQFRHLKRLILWHGRLAQLRSTKLSAFIIHRGLVIGVIQIFFSSVFYFTPLAVFQGWLQVGYSTYYTMLPVFSLVYDQDVPPHVCFLFPELYKTDENRTLNDLTFAKILFMSIYQGAAIMVGALLLFDEQLINFVAIAFTALILLELLNVATEVLTWHRAMVVAELASVALYLLSLVCLPEYFDLTFVFTTTFWYKVSAITVLSWLPVHCYK
ncbi:putative phospholipid-transporting ATPase, partial [Gregarina niphandrodes]